MKRLVLFSWVLLLALPAYCPALFENSEVELKGGYVFFSSSKMRSIYDNGGPSVQLAASAPIWRCLSLYGSVGFQEQSGRSLFLRQPTRLWKIPVDLGLKQSFYMAPMLEFYVAAGPRYFYLHQDNHSDDVKSPTYSGIGGFANSGFRFAPWCRFFLDLFGEYSFEQAHCRPHSDRSFGRTIQVGGFLIGLGLGYQF